MGPFEIFRKPINLYRQQPGQYVQGNWVQGPIVTLSTQLITGNTFGVFLQIDNTLPTYSQVFSVSHQNTMNLLRDKILQNIAISQVIISDDYLSMIIIADPSVAFNILNGVVTGGASQPVVTWGNSAAVIVITASVQPANGEDMLSVPEGRRNRKTYALFTSTPVEVIHGLNNSTNPDQVEIYGERYEIIKVEVWQNNPPVFGIVNHYKFIASALEAIP